MASKETCQTPLLWSCLELAAWWLAEPTMLGSCYIKGRTLEFRNPISAFSKPGFQVNRLDEEAKKPSFRAQN